MTTIVVFLFVIPAVTVLITEYGTSTGVQNYNNLSASAYHYYNTSLYNPVSNGIGTNIKYSENLYNASAIVGFSLAFILPNMALIFQSLIQAPVVLANILGFALQAVPGLNLPGANCQVTSNSTTNNLTCQPFIDAIITDIISLIVLFVFFIAFAAWQKYPIFGATG